MTQPTRLNARAIRIWIAEQDTTLRGLAEKAGVSREYLSRIVTGKQPLTAGVLYALHKATGLHINQLELGKQPVEGRVA